MITLFRDHLPVGILRGYQSGENKASSHIPNPPNRQIPNIQKAAALATPHLCHGYLRAALIAHHQLIHLPAAELSYNIVKQTWGRTVSSFPDNR